jgi:Fe2+ or Zn2+ uptake regulation protein
MHEGCIAHAEGGRLLHEAMERARATGLRRTRALEDVLHILIDARRPLTLADVASSRQLASGADHATVYRLLTRLEERGIIRRLGLHDRSAYYTIIQPGEHHDYLICTRCGRIERLEISCPVHALEEQIGRQSGFRGLYHELEFFGVCPRCASPE